MLPLVSTCVGITVAPIWHHNYGLYVPVPSVDRLYKSNGAQPSVNAIAKCVSCQLDVHTTPGHDIKSREGKQFRHEEQTVNNKTFKNRVEEMSQGAGAHPLHVGASDVVFVTTKHTRPGQASSDVVK